MNRTAIACTSICCFTLAGTAILLAGPLDPPSGPVSSTYKTLTEVEPRIAINAANTPGDVDSLFKITQPGSYYLVGNVTGVSGKHGIEIATSGVTLDMSGFTLDGVPGSLDGITSGADLTSISVRGGTARWWGRSGVNLAAAAGPLGIEEVLASENAQLGIVAGEGAALSNCAADRNGIGGISVSHASTLRSCIARGNAGLGISSAAQCVLTGCVAEGNGAQGFQLSGGSGVGCAAWRNREGFVVHSGASLESCSAESNSTSGFLIASGAASLRGCVALANAQYGIITSGAATITECIARNNGFGGIDINTASIVVGCTVAWDLSQGAPPLSGIFVGGDGNTVERNTVSGHSYGIDVEPFYDDTDAGFNRIERNTVTSNGVGIFVGNTATRNLIAGNTAGGNTTNYQLDTNNAWGGFSNVAAGESFSTSNCWANLEY